MPNSKKTIDLRKKENQLVRGSIGKEGGKKKEGGDKSIISWTITESRKRKGFLWYFVVFIIAIIFIIISIIQKNWLFLGIIFLSIFIYIIINRQEGKKFIVKMSSFGIDIGRKRYNFSQIEGFGFIPRGDEDFLVLETSQFGQKFLVIPYEDNKDEIGNFLINYLPEKEYENSLLDALENFLMF